VVDGFICKKPTLRTTPSGKQICDLLIACNYNKDKTAYLPIIVWGRAARQIGKASVGSHIQIIGRVQSRVYTKHSEDGQMHEHMAYEISATTITESSQTLFSLN
jgi:single-stranded DNA-binding protein